MKEHYEDLFKFRDEEIELVNDIKMYSRKRPATPTNEKNSNYFMSWSPSYKTTRTPGRYDGAKSEYTTRGRTRSEYEKRVDKSKNENYNLASSRAVEKS
ncbi:MAG: hypothetical protein ACMG6E_09270 [Candidatus Roizmanbacteria bacterium]